MDFLSSYLSEIVAFLSATLNAYLAYKLKKKGG